MIVTEVVDDTVVVVIVKLTEVAPAATVTLAGTCAAAMLLLVSVTAAPPAGAGPVSFTVPVEELPPTTELGLTVRPLPLPVSVGAKTVRVAVRLEPYFAVTVTDVFVATGEVVTVNVAVVAPAATVTVAGTCATAVLLLERTTNAPLDGAA